eukprot:scaffold8952_cov42-Phaeocystis_antarctica.AAC.3
MSLTTDPNPNPGPTYYRCSSAPTTPYHTTALDTTAPYHPTALPPYHTTTPPHDCTSGVTRWHLPPTLSLTLAPRTMVQVLFGVYYTFSRRLQQVSPNPSPHPNP